MKVTTTKGKTYPFVLKLLIREATAGSVVLETGSGRAQYRQLVTEIGAKYVGSDLPNAYYNNIGVVDVYCSSDSLPFASDSVDLVFNQGSIDYMPNVVSSMQEAYRVLTEGGKFLVVTYDYETLSKIHQKVSLSQRKWEKDHHVFTSEMMLAYLAEAGFEAKDVSFFQDSWWPKAWIRLPLKVIGLYPIFNRFRTKWRVFEGKKKVV